MSIGELIASIGADTSDFEKGMARVENRMKSAGKSMQKAGRQMSLMVTAPLLAVGGLGLRTAANFEQAMNQVAAVSGATGESFARLEKMARDLGASTKFSATEAAEGMNFLAMAGFSVDETMQALPATLNLAAAGNMQLAESADIVSNIMQGFGIQAARTSEITDVLSKTFTSSNTSLSQLGEAMSYVAPAAKAFGQEIMMTSAAIGMLSDAGIQGSRAGTGLRQALIQLQKKSDDLGISVTDTNGEMLSLADILENIERQGLTTARVIQTIGPRGGTALAALMDRGSGALREFTTELENAGGTTAKVADKQMQGLNGALTELKSALSEVAISFSGEFMGAIEGAVDRVRDAARWLGELDGRTKKIIIGIAAFAAALGPTILVLGAMTSAVGALAGAFAALMSPVTLVIAAIAAVGAATIYVVDNWEALKERVSDISWWKNSLIEMVKFLGKMSTKMLDLLLWPIRQAAKAFGLEVPAMIETIDPLLDKLDKFKSEPKEYANEFGSFGDAMKNAFNKAMGALGLFQTQMQAGGAGSEEIEAASESAENYARSLEKPISKIKILSGEITQAAEEIDKMSKRSSNIITPEAIAGVDEMAEKMKSMAATIQEEVNIALTEAAAATSAIIGKVLAGGLSLKKAGAAIGSAILGTLADLAVRVGKIAIGTAIAIEGIKKALQSLNPVLAAAAGVALIALGSFVKSKLNSEAESFQGLATGGQVTQSGTFWVGEQGPELATLPRGTAVTPNHAIGSNRMSDYDEKLVTSFEIDRIAIMLERHKRNTGRIG